MWKKAVELGIQEIAITDHFEPSKGNEKYSFYDSKENLLEILEVRKIFGKNLKIKFGIELGQLAKACLPDLDIVRFYRELGGQVITMGSDAHYAEDVGKGIKEAVEIAKIAGFEYITVFNNRKPEWIKITDDQSIYYFKNQLKLA